ncbi:KATNB1-like protein 1 [Protopterus annectens]|uniref:KATNB1-like protein 1 n=1 Tax=Protopterus annectens TaxID=7888 RepID=UPI001CFB4BCC|nr:KATNB1-like protein 1 [Protopterus annectens]XP_043929909.1 KATNB1-like protein 1 [Protopterus annectens]
MEAGDHHVFEIPIESNLWFGRTRKRNHPSTKENMKEVIKSRKDEETLICNISPFEETGGNSLSLCKVVCCRGTSRYPAQKHSPRKRQHSSNLDCAMANKENEVACGGNTSDKLHNEGFTFHIRTHNAGSSHTEMSSKYSDFFAEIAKDHDVMAQVLFGRNLRLNVALTFWRRRSVNELVAYLLRIQDISVLVDCLPALTKSLQDKKPYISLGCCVDLLPQVKNLLKSQYEEYVLVGLRWLLAVILKWWPELSGTKNSVQQQVPPEDENLKILKQQLGVLWEQDNHLTLIPGYTGDIAKSIVSYLSQLG